VRTALQRLLADARASVRGLAVLACAPGERHEIGLLMLAVLLRADGWQVAYLGADTPVDDALSLAESLAADALCFSATCAEHGAALRRALDASSVPSRLTVLVGGAAGDERNLNASVSRMRKLAA
jgi:methanogenic corrinoid protein MtbC1